LEPAGIGGAGDAPGIVAVVDRRRAVGVDQADDRAPLVGKRVAAAGDTERRAFVDRDRLVDAGAMDVAP